MRRLSLAALAAALAGCVPMDPDDVFYYLGRVTDLASAPRGEAAVALWRSRALYCSGTERSSLRIDPQGVTLDLSYEHLRDATAREDGRFYFDLMRFEIAATDYDQRCFALVAGGGNGARTRSVIFGKQMDVEFPDLPVWDGVALAEEAGAPPRVPAPALPWEPNAGAPPDPGGAGFRRVAYDWVVTGDAGALIWHEITTGDPLLLRPELLEDFAGPRASLQAWINEIVVRNIGPLATPDATSFLTTVQSSERPLASPGTVAASRGAACSFNGEALAGCPLTDGALELVMLDSLILDSPGPGMHDQFVLELTQPIVPRLLVARDLHGTGGGVVALTVEGSPDGDAWLSNTPEPLFEFSTLEGIPEMTGFLGTGQHFAAPLDFGGQPVRWIRITAQQGSVFLAARELSVFE